MLTRELLLHAARVLDTTLTNINDFAYTFNRDGNFLYANRALLEMLGISLEEIIGKNFFDLGYPSELAARLQKQIQQVFDTKKSLTDETPFTTPKGVNAIYEYIFSPVIAENGEVELVACSTRDIGQHRKAQEDLHESVARFRTLSDSLPQLIWTNNAEGEANYFNRRWFDYSGLSFEQSEGLGWQAMVHPDDAPASVERWHQDLAASEIFETEYRLRRADGVYRWQIGRNVPLKDSADRVLAWFGSATDIDDLKRSEAERGESEERYRLLVEDTKDYAMFLMDTERCIIHWNNGAERIFGFTRDEAMGQSGDIIFIPEDRAAGAAEEEMQTAIAQGRAPDQRWHLRRDGSVFWANGVMTSLHDDAGALRGFAKILRDATKEREAEEQLRRAHDEQENRVRERTLELALTNQSLHAEMAQRLQIEQERAQLMQRIVTIQEEERRRISRDLHDSMGQQLTALLIGLQTLPEWPEPGPRSPSYPQQIETLRVLATDLIKHTQQLAWEVRPAALDNLGLEATLQQSVEEWSQRYKVPAAFVARGFAQAQRAAEPIETALYRVVQEALTNVQRHAQATQISVILEREGGSIAAVIEDNGRGFVDDGAIPDDRVPSRRLGLLGMRERMELIGGSLVIESALGAGTTIYARAPLKLPGQNQP